jgi:hypothetical protein
MVFVLAPDDDACVPSHLSSQRFLSGELFTSFKMFRVLNFFNIVGMYSLESKNNDAQYGKLIHTRDEV